MEVLNSLEGCPSPKQAGALNHFPIVRRSGWPGWKSSGDPRGCSPPFLPAQPTFQIAGQMTRSPGPSHTPLVSHETRELLDSSAGRHEQELGKCPARKPFEDRGTRQPGVLQAPCPARPMGKDMPGFPAPAAAPGLPTSRPAVTWLAWMVWNTSFF